MINNGERARLVIDGVFEGEAGLQGNQLAFLQNRTGKNPATARGALLNGEPVLIRTQRDPDGPFWLATYERIA
jgi:hypothetical protein